MSPGNEGFHLTWASVFTDIKETNMTKPILHLMTLREMGRRIGLLVWERASALFRARSFSA